jgi:predicted nucleic acid-binding Zn ribbon protein
MEDLKHILSRLFKDDPKLRQSGRHFAVHDIWAETVGEKIARHARPLKILDGQVLLVATDNSAWSHQLRLMERQLLEKLNGKLSQPLKGLRFCQSST